MVEQRPIVLVVQGTKDGVPYVHQNYSDRLIEHGLIPQVIHHSEGAHQKERKFQTASGILVPGGLDVYPPLYGEPIDPDLNYDPERDEFELDLISWALPMKTPILALCHGEQVLAVHQGAKLTRQVSDFPIRHGNGQNGYDDLVNPRHWHEVTFDPNSKTGVIFAATPSVITPGNHHQVVNRVYHGNVKVVGVAPDGEIEAIEVLGNKAFQFHPEVNHPTIRRTLRPIFADFAQRVIDHHNAS